MRNTRGYAIGLIASAALGVAGVSPAATSQDAPIASSLLEARLLDDRLILKLSPNAAARARGLPEIGLPTGLTELDAWSLENGVRDGFRLTREHGTPIGDWELFHGIGLDRIYVLELPARDERRVRALVRELSGQPWVDYAEPVYLYEMATTVPNDPSFPQQWAHDNVGQTGGQPDADMDTPEAWDVATGGPGGMVAVIDSGVDEDHPDLVDNLVEGFDFTTGTTDTDDPFGHGTAVAGNAAARGNNAIGVAGVCWGCSILPLKIFGPSGFVSTEQMADAVRMAADRDADAINLSLTGIGWSQAFIDAVDYATGLGTLTIAASGNTGTYGLFLPAALPSVVSVQGTDASDQRFGSTNDLQELSAPSGSLTTDTGGGYAPFGGTSAAAPHAAGLAALLRATDPGLHVQELRQLLRLGAEDGVGSPAEDTAGWDLFYGFGRLNAAATMALIDGPWVAFDRPHYVCGGTLTVDHKDPGAGASVDVTLGGDLGGDVETASLLPVTAEGYYSSSFPVAWAGRDGPVVPGDGKLDVEHGETVTASVGGVSATATLDCVKRVCLHDVPPALRSGDCDLDGAVDPGELWTIQATFVNQQTEPVPGLAPMLSMTSPDLEILVDSALVGDLLPSTISAPASFLIRVPAGAPANVTLPLSVAVHGEGWESDEAACRVAGLSPDFSLVGNRDLGAAITRWDFDGGTAEGWTHGPAHGSSDLSECVGGYGTDEWSGPVSDRAHSGTFAMRLGNGGGYSIQQDAALISPPFAVPAGGGALGFHLWAETEASLAPLAYDGLVVESKSTVDSVWSYRSGTTYNALLDAEHCFAERVFPFGVSELMSLFAGDGTGTRFTGDSFDREHQIALDHLDGQQGQVRFRFGADNMTPAPPGQGVWIDTITLYGPHTGDSWPGTAPSALAGSTVSCPASFELSWDAVTGATGYDVYRSELSCEDAQLLPAPIGTSAAAAFSDVSVTPNVTYFYGVAAHEAGTGCPTERACIAGGCFCMPPADPENLLLAKAGADLALTWDDPNLPGVSWNAYRDATPDPAGWGPAHANGIVDAEPGVPGIQWTDPGALAASSPLFYLVTAQDVCGESPFAPIGDLCGPLVRRIASRGSSGCSTSLLPEPMFACDRLRTEIGGEDGNVGRTVGCRVGSRRGEAAALGHHGPPGEADPQAVLFARRERLVASARLPPRRTGGPVEADHHDRRRATRAVVAYRDRLDAGLERRRATG